MRIRNRFTSTIILETAMLAGTIAAQTTNPPALQTFNIERALPLSALNTTLTPNIPAAILAGVQSGSSEIRESITYNPQNQSLTINLFTVAAGAPLPTPAGTAITSNTFSTLVVNVDKVYLGTTPNDSVMFAGMAMNSPASPFGNLNGEPVAVAAGYTTDATPKISNVTTMIAGIVVEYSPSAGGTLSFNTTPPPPAGSGIQIVVKAPASTVMNFITLDASATTGGTPPYKFSWTATSGAATVFGANSAVATAQLFSIGGYIFQVSVTDSKGNTAQQMVNVTYN